MRIIRKVLKWIGLSIGSSLLLIILVGLCLRIFSDKPQPAGKLVDIGGFKLHINSSGEKSNKPTLVIEGGSGMATEYYHWLNEGLKDSMRVVRYDRAGIGYSEASDTPREPETIARELHMLLKNAGESPPYILAGHSLGGPYIRVFTQLYPEEVKAMLLLDSTHPERAEKIKSIPQKSSLKFKSMIWLYDFQSVLADMGVMKLFDKLMGPVLHREMEGLPDEINSRTADFLTFGKYIKTIGKEFELYHSTLKRAGRASNFGSLPIRIFSTAVREIPEEDYKNYIKKGIDLRDSQIKSMEMQKDLVSLSTNSKLILIDGNHTSIFTKKENADIICKEIIQLLVELKF